MLPVAGPFSDGSLSKTSTQCSLMRTCEGTHQWGCCEASSMVLRATTCSSSGCAGQYVLSALLQTQLCRSWHHLLVQNSVEICWCCECGNETLGSVRHSQSVNISAWWGQQWQLMKCSKLSQSGYSFAQKQFIACTYSWVVWLCKLWWPADTIVENEEWLLHEVTLQLLFCFQSTVFPGP